MNRQSDFGRLFRRSAFGPQEPIENYVSEALAIAIEHDDRLMRRALAEVRWPDSSLAFDPDLVTGIEPRTQHFLPPGGSNREGASDGPGVGYLDLALEITLADGAARSAWVEVKAETGEHGEQLDAYAEHASQHTPRPSIFTLSKYDIRKPKHLSKGIGWLRWKCLARAIEEFGGEVDGRWNDLLEFLGEEGIAWRSLEPDPRVFEAHVEVLVKVNELIKTRWAWAGMAWAPESLRKAALGQLTDHNQLTVTAGPLTYGLVPSSEGWLWSLTVGCQNAQRVRLDHVAMRRQADGAGLPDRWGRSTTRSAVLSLQVLLRGYTDREDAAAWFAAALGELEAHGVLRSFLDGLVAKKNGHAGVPEP